MQSIFTAPETSRPTARYSRPTLPATIMVVDDDPLVARTLARLLRGSGHTVDVATDGNTAALMADAKKYDLVLADVAMPEVGGVELLRRLRAKHRDVAVVLVTGGPAVDTAMKAVEYGALRYLVKPVEPALLDEVVRQATRRSRQDQAMLEALTSGARLVLNGDDEGELEHDFDEALASAYMAYQPIVRWSQSRTHAYEALLRSRHPKLSTPAHLLGAAELLGRLPEIGRTVRALVAKDIPELSTGAEVYVNIHPRDLEDPDLYDADSPLFEHARRVVLELTERSPLSTVVRLPEKLGRLRLLGYRIAVDDLGEGYAGLSSFARLAPDVVKIDMSLVRNIDREKTQQRIVSAFRGICRELGMELVAEGVETNAELVMLRQLGCDLFQGYLIGRPQPIAASPAVPVAA